MWNSGMLADSDRNVLGCTSPIYPTPHGGDVVSHEIHSSAASFSLPSQRWSNFIRLSSSWQDVDLARMAALLSMPPGRAHVERPQITKVGVLCDQRLQE